MVAGTRGALGEMRGKEPSWEGRGTCIHCPPTVCLVLPLKVEMGWGWRLVTFRYVHRTEQ